MYNLPMRKFLFVLTILCISLSVKSGYVYAFDKCGQDCMKCHSLTADDAKAALKDLIPDVKILDVRQAPLKGLWEVAIESGGRKNVLYLDFSKKKVIAGNLVDIKTRTNHTQESFQRINKVDFSSIPLDKSVIMGDKDAKYKVVVFDDPE
jgi:thiol:disulfide interchange protein DsbC